jgi:hypothetical protein
VCEVLTEQGTSKAILLGEKGLMMADQLLRSSDTVANFRVAMPVRGILERALEPVYEKAGEVLKLKELRDRKERQSTRYEEIKKDGYVDSISGFNMELTAFPLVSLAEQLIVAELDDEVQVYRELASWLGTKSGLPE